MFTVWEEGVILTEEERFSEIPPGIANNEVLRGVWSELVGMMPKEVLDNLDEMDGLFIEAMCRHYAIARKASNEVISADSVLVTDNLITVCRNTLLRLFSGHNLRHSLLI